MLSTSLVERSDLLSIQEELLATILMHLCEISVFVCMQSVIMAKLVTDALVKLFVKLHNGMNECLNFSTSLCL